MPRFLSELRTLPHDEQEVVLSVLLLAQLLDGGIEKPVRRARKTTLNHITLDFAINMPILPRQPQPSSA